jgi:hypothetical protein
MTITNSKIINLKIILDGSWDVIPDINDFNLDVFLQFDTGEHFVVTVITPKNFLTIMDNMNIDQKMNFYADYSMIVVREMTYEIVFETLTKMLDIILENQHQKSIEFKKYLESEED